MKLFFKRVDFKEQVTKTTAPTDSHILSYYSTDAALTILTSEIERDPVFSSRYGRS
jgi:hypothetical protein